MAVYDDQKEKSGSANPLVEGQHDDLGVHPERREAENEQLENQFNQPSHNKDTEDLANREGAADQKNRVDGSKSVSPGGLQAAEAGGAGASLYSGDDGDKKSFRDQLKGAITKKRVGAGGGIIGLILGGGFGLSVISGPAQFAQMAQLLQRFHFAPIEDTGDSRMLKLYKYGKGFKEGTLEDTRLGIAGKRMATKLDINNKFSDIGVTKEFDALGVYQGTVIDPEVYAENAVNGEQYKGLSKQEFVDKFNKDNSVRLSINEEGKVISPSDSGFWNYFRNRSLNSTLADESGMGKITGAISTRIMGARDGVTWHPIKAIDSNITGTIDNKLTGWLAEIKSRIRNGAPDEALTAAADTTAVDDKGKPDAQKITDNESATADTNAISKSSAEATKQAEENIANGTEATTADVGNGVIRQFTESTGGKVGLGVTAVIGLTCAAQGIAKAADNLKHDLVVLPMIRVGMQAISLGNQVMSGQDIDSDQLGFFAKQFTDQNGASWTSAKSIQAELGEPTTGPDIPDSANIAKIQQGSMFTQFLNGIPGLSAVCAVTNSFLGGLAMTVVGAITSPVATIGQTILAQSGALNSVIGSIVRWVAGSPLPTMAFGPELGSVANYGVRLAANDSNAAMGGIPLTKTQSTAWKEVQTGEQHTQFASESFTQRVLNPYSPDSLVGKAIDNQPGGVTQTVASTLASVLNPSKSIFHSFSTIFSRPVAAQATSSYDYGFPEVGFSLDDLSASAYDDPYNNACYVVGCHTDGQNITGVLENPQTAAPFISRAQACFGITLSEDGSVVSSLAPLDVTKKNFYSDDNNCADSSQTWTRIRFYILDTKIAESGDCFETGDAQSCADVGFGADSTSPSTTSAPATNGNIYEVGDSLSVGMRDLGGLAPSLQAQGWSSTVMAECGRHLALNGDNCSGQPVFGGLNQIDQPADQTAIKAAGVVIIGLGTNDPGDPNFGANITTMVTKIRTLNPTAKIYWINLYTTDGNAAKYQAMDSVLGQLAKAGNVTVLDWATQAAKVGAYGPNSLHPQNYKAMADFVVSQLGHAP